MRLESPVTSQLSVNVLMLLPGPPLSLHVSGHPIPTSSLIVQRMGVGVGLGAGVGVGMGTAHPPGIKVATHAKKPTGHVHEDVELQLKKVEHGAPRQAVNGSGSTAQLGIGVGVGVGTGVPVGMGVEVGIGVGVAPAKTHAPPTQIKPKEAQSVVPADTQTLPEHLSWVTLDPTQKSAIGGPEKSVQVPAIAATLATSVSIQGTGVGVGELHKAEVEQEKAEPAMQHTSVARQKLGPQEPPQTVPQGAGVGVGAPVGGGTRAILLINGTLTKLLNKPTSKNAKKAIISPTIEYVIFSLAP